MVPSSRVLDDQHFIGEFKEVPLSLKMFEVKVDRFKENIGFFVHPTYTAPEGYGTCSLASGQNNYIHRAECILTYPGDVALPNLRATLRYQLIYISLTLMESLFARHDEASNDTKRASQSGIVTFDLREKHLRW